MIAEKLYTGVPSYNGAMRECDGAVLWESSIKELWHATNRHVLFQQLKFPNYCITYLSLH